MLYGSILKSWRDFLYMCKMFRTRHRATPMRCRETLLPRLSLCSDFLAVASLASLSHDFTTTDPRLHGTRIVKQSQLERHFLERTQSRPTYIHPGDEALKLQWLLQRCNLSSTMTGRHQSELLPVRFPTVTTGIIL